MATYKVIQDIEAEDKLLGPLTLRQFIYAAIVIVVGFIAFKLSQVNFLLALPLLPPIFFFGLLAAPFGRDQSSEVWLLAKIRFMLKPRKRIWDQSGMQQLVTITAPKKIEKHLTDDLSQTEVKSRLQALANTLDSRGWAIKNVNVSMSQPVMANGGDDDSDRLVTLSNVPQDTPISDVTAADDILDENSNPTAQHLQNMINESAQARHQSLMATASGHPVTAVEESPLIMPPSELPAISPEAEKALLDKIHKEQSQPNPVYEHMKVVQPLGAKKPKTTLPNKAETSSPAKANPDILRLANNNDLNVSTIARQANEGKQPPDDEVVISLR